ncbi:GPP34 family phosphoprotein [Actinoplanes bogorensis]|uniref:GPP34 family phosphoprotein n=1 Tax=Paractinoplanes bogorensis TaxID=1610840 RepID=A0ABS5YXI0_9ACTN|nr:GPP34 family phosphoprotein [Actinoplanes bogorensis]MBU2668143.1 GPP34 family phosphoprotein [Actinoplanes bogorensis]
MSLPESLFLLSLRPDKGRLDDDSAAVRGSLLRSAALAELRLRGLLRDHDGHPERTDAAPAQPLEPFLTEVLDDVRPDRRHGWFELVHNRSDKAEATVRDQLAANRTIIVETHRVLGLLPTQRLTLTDPTPVEALRDRVRRALHQDAPIEDALLAVLAADGNVSTVYRWRDLRGQSSALRALRQRIDRELTGLRPATEAAIAVQRSPA